MKEIIFSPNAPLPIGPYSQAVRQGDVVYLSGQIGIDPQTQELCSDEMLSQLQQILKNMDAVLSAAATNKNNFLKLTIYLTDMTGFPEVNSVMNEYFGENFPARETVEVRGLPKGAKIEISALAGAE